MGYPKLLSAEESSCLCSSCFKDQLKQKIDEIVQLPKVERQPILDRMEAMSTLKEGIHFDYNEEGLMVLSAWYLLRRGYCCGNGCQNCPY